MSAAYLPEVESFEPFGDLPGYQFTATSTVVFDSQDLQVSVLEAGHFAIYRITYLLMPPGHPGRYSDLVYDLRELQEQRRKVYQIYDAKGSPMTLGQGTYDIGLLFSGGRVYADRHFRKTYWEPIAH